MIHRVYVNNFRCLENFSIELSELSSALIIGKNGSGKSTFREALGVFQGICRRSNRVKDLIKHSDFTQGRTHVPIRFEIEFSLDQQRFNYSIAFEMPPNFHEARVAHEQLTVDADVIFTRQLSQVTLANGMSFGLDWHIVGLPVISERPKGNLIQRVKSFFASMILIEPIPANMTGFAEEETIELQVDASNVSAWFNALLSQFPASYSLIEEYLRQVIPDFDSVKNELRGEKGKQLRVNFREAQSDQFMPPIDFGNLSHGEKCFFLSALIVASSRVSGPIFCLWDESDSHLSLPEVGQFVTRLRKLANGSQLIATSHHPEAIRRFTDESTLVFHRRSHFEPTVVRVLRDLPYQGDLIEALIRNEIVE